MLCSDCNKNNAEIFINKIENGVSSMEGLCKECAKKRGIDVPNIPNENNHKKDNQKNNKETEQAKKNDNKSNNQGNNYNKDNNSKKTSFGLPHKYGKMKLEDLLQQ